MEFARRHKKPRLHLWAGDNAAADKLKAFTEEHHVKILNVAGPRASNEPWVGEFVMRTLEEVFGEIGPVGSPLLLNFVLVLVVLVLESTPDTGVMEFFGVGR